MTAELHSTTDIRRALAEQYDETTSGRRTVRTSIADLIVVAGSDEIADQVANAIASLPRNRPSRALVCVTRAGAEQIDAETSVFCAVPPDGTGPSLVCSELIRIDAPEGGEALASVITSLLLPDLPVYLVWLEDGRLDSTLARRLRSVATRLVIDSRRWPEALATVVPLLQHRGRSTDVVVTDLAWSETQGMREAIARLFDHPAHTALLAHLERVTISHQPDGESQAKLLAGWLSSRTKARPRILLTDVDAPDGPGVIERVELVCSGQRFCVERDPSGGARAQSPGLPDQRFRLEEPSLADLIAAELELLQADMAFEDAARAAVAL